MLKPLLVASTVLFVFSVQAEARPHHTDSRAAGIHAFARPGACQRKATVRFSKIFAQVTAAPGVRPVTVMPVVGTRLGLNGKDEQDRRRDKEGL